MSEKAPNAKRIACVGKDDERFIDRLVRGLELRGLRARHLSLPALRMAPRPPDLTVLIGNAVDDGGAAVLATLGPERGPYAAVMPSGALAARLEARQRGLHVVPRKEDGSETAGLIAKLLADLASGSVAPSAPSAPAPVALDGLDWDEDERETVSEPQAVPWRAGAGRGVAKPPPNPAAPPRTTLPGGVSFPPPPARSPKELARTTPAKALELAHPSLAEPGGAALDDVTVPGGAPLLRTEDAPSVHDAETREVALPPDRDESTLASASGERTLDDPKGALELALGMNAAESAQPK
ncbi:MAG TPA: hypothetical protein VIL20_03665, partial [Sandaracinaceae bacterium]